ncbi:hypothetical protein [Lysobacter xanthus]
MSAFLLFASALTLALACALALLLRDALRRERHDDEARMQRRARALRLPVVVGLRYAGNERRRLQRATTVERRAA